MSVHMWGESPLGVWQLEVSNEGRYMGKPLTNQQNLCNLIFVINMVIYPFINPRQSDVARLVINIVRHDFARRQKRSDPVPESDCAKKEQRDAPRHGAGGAQKQPRKTSRSGAYVHRRPCQEEKE